MRHVKWLVGAALVVMTTGIASGQDLTGTLKKIKDTGTITLGHRERRSRSPTTTTSSRSSATRWTSA